jgi:hypothetical protein
LTGEDDVVFFNWGKNHYLGNIKMVPLVWRTLLRAVYNRIGDRSPARDYMFTGMYVNQDDLRAAYENVHGVVNDYVETIFSDLQKI